MIKVDIMKTKTIARMTYEGLGFPIELRNVKMVMINDEWHPKINMRKIADATMKVLASQEKRFTGYQVKFIRTYFNMTLRDFASEVVSESHTAVSKWEKFGSKPTNMDINIEKILRLYIYEKVNKKKKFYRDLVVKKNSEQKKQQIIRPEIQISAV